jgi:hemerythrin-like domain-containing protein
MNKLLRTLVAEHDHIQSVITALHDYAGLHAQDDPDPRPTIAKFVHFFREYLDSWHHHKEEDLLFDVMVRAGMPKSSGPIACMLHEHEAGRAQVRALAALAEGKGPLSRDELGALVEATHAFAAVLVPHIGKENQVLYPMAERMLPPEVLDALDEAGDAYAARRGEMVGRDLEALGAELVARFTAARIAS